MCVRRSSPSCRMTPQTVIFPACVGVREREFTPRSSEGGWAGKGIGACTCEGENRHRVRCFCVARVREISGPQIRGREAESVDVELDRSRVETHCETASRISDLPRYFLAPLCGTGE